MPKRNMKPRETGPNVSHELAAHVWSTWQTIGRDIIDANDGEDLSTKDMVDACIDYSDAFIPPKGQHAAELDRLLDAFPRDDVYLAIAKVGWSPKR